MFSGQKFLVAGGTGFLGGAIARRLLEQGAQVRATYSSRSPTYSHPNLKWLHADLCEEAGCLCAVEGVDYVINCAASTSGAADIRATPLIHVTPNVV
jgi:nucleoside-diphosphate-sugar epimerase